jgi:hypothetical protein
MNRRPKQNKKDPLVEYEKKQAEIKQLLKQIEVGLKKHDQDASRDRGGHHWGYVGDLVSIAETLSNLRDRLHWLGEYAKQ